MASSLLSVPLLAWLLLLESAHVCGQGIGRSSCKLQCDNDNDVAIQCLA